MSLANKMAAATPAAGLPTSGWSDANISSLGEGFVTKWNNVPNINQAVTNTVFWIGIAVALAFGVINGVKYAMSGGDKLAAQQAKQGVTNAFIGFIIVIGFRSIVQLIMALLGASGTIPDTTPSFN